MLKLQHIVTGSIDESRISELVRFKVETPVRYEDDINLLASGRQVQLINSHPIRKSQFKPLLPSRKSQLTAGEFHLNMEWALVLAK
ncbi:hypothetical protein O9992_25205 [Vibrio lentus]|nr:hypothetical protein [Vibrio lentus]